MSFWGDQLVDRCSLVGESSLQIGQDLDEDLDLQEQTNGSIQKLLQAVQECNGSITANTNESYLVNYGDRYRNGETISTAFAESTVNEVKSQALCEKATNAMGKRGST